MACRWQEWVERQMALVIERNPGIDDIGLASKMRLTPSMVRQARPSAERFLRKAQKQFSEPPPKTSWRRRLWNLAAPRERQNDVDD